MCADVLLRNERTTVLVNVNVMLYFSHTHTQTHTHTRTHARTHACTNTPRNLHTQEPTHTCTHAEPMLNYACGPSNQCPCWALSTPSHLLSWCSPLIVVVDCPPSALNYSNLCEGFSYIDPYGRYEQQEMRPPPPDP